jgi:transposase
MESYLRAAVERAMKIQEVILRAVAKKITWTQAGEIIGLCERQMRRWKERYEEFGYDGLFDRRLGKPSPKRVPLKTVEEILRLYQEQYADFNVRHFHEKLREKHHLRLSYTWVKRALQMAGLVKKSRKRGVHRRRPRRPLPGMLLHLDGSSHAWFQGSSLRSAGDSRRCDQRDLLCAAGGRRIDRHGHDRFAGGDRAKRRFLCAVQRSGQPFLPYSESRSTGRSHAADASGAGSAGIGDSNDSGLLATGARPKRTQMWIDKPGSAKNTLSQKWVETLKRDDRRFKQHLDFGQQTTVETTTLDKLIAEHGLPFFIKIDVEGHEPSVLRGLHSAVPYLSFEVNLPEFASEGQECVEILSRLAPAGKFNYARSNHQQGQVLQTCALRTWLAAPEFVPVLASCTESSIDVFWKSAPSSIGLTDAPRSPGTSG